MVRNILKRNKMFVKLYEAIMGPKNQAKYEKAREYMEIHEIAKRTSDLMWARIWSDTKEGVDFLCGENFAISPGRWAVGYNYVYVMTRILDEIQPHFILDMGLGISSTLISKYLTYKKFDDGKHIIAEHDKEWITFYCNQHKLSPYSSVQTQNLVTKSINGTSYYAYENLVKTIGEKIKFQVISIDGPFGSPQYSRRDILDLIPQYLDERFVIIMDDVNREGEKNTISDIEKSLCQNNIKYVKGIYEGMSDCCVIVSENYKFLCTL